MSPREQLVINIIIISSLFQICAVNMQISTNVKRLTTEAVVSTLLASIHAEVTNASAGKD